MDPLLPLLGVLGAACAGSVLGSLCWLRKRFQQESAYHRAAAIHRFPQRLRLKRVEPFAWRKLSRGPQRVDSFHALGFEDLAGFTVDEIPGARVFALRHPGTGALGLVNEHEQLGTWSDVLMFTSGECQPALASSILKHAHFFLLPGSPKVHKRGASEQELAAAVLGAVGKEAVPSTVTTERFAALYEEAFADAIDRRLLEPLNDGELRRLLREHKQPCCGDQLSDKEFDQIKRLYPAAVANELRLACAAQFLRETALPASQWQEARDRILVLHDRTPLPQLAGRLIYGAYLTDAMKQRLRGHKSSQPPRESFARFNSTLPPWERYKRIGEVARPVPADIYRAPVPRETA